MTQSEPKSDAARRGRALSRALSRSAALLAAAAALLAGCGEPEAPAGAGGAGAPEEGGPPWFEDARAAARIDFVHSSGHVERRLFPEIACGGGALLDLEDDGDLDVYLVQAGDLLHPRKRAPNRLYRNDGRAVFEDATAGSGADDRGYGMGAAVGDVDEDGDADLYVTNLEDNVLLANDGTGRFRDVTARAGVAEPRWSTSAAFFDPDADGDLDLFVANYIFWSPADEITCERSTGTDYCGPLAYDAPAPDALYRNEGDGTFTDVSFEVGLRAAFGNGLGVVCSDFDGDGRVDVYVANDLTPNQLWMNRGDGTFADQGLLAGVAFDDDGRAKAGMGVDCADLDDDGDEDLLVVNLFDETDSFYRNDGGYFVDMTEVSGLGATRRFTRFGCVFGDFDQDGVLDLYEADGRVYQQATRWSDDPYAEPNLLFRGLSGGRFEEVLPRGGTAAPLVATSRAAAVGDLDGDGALDVLVVNRDAAPYLLLNRVPGRGAWIAFRVRERSGRDALGAMVTVSLGERELRRDVRAAKSYLSSSDPRVHFGLGAAAGVDEVRVRWADGALESFGSRAAGAVHELSRGSGRPAGGR